MITAYIKTQYCYGKDEFNLYEPFQVPSDAIFAKDSKNECHNILSSDGKSVLFHTNNKHTYVKSFTTNKDNLLLSDYINNPRYVESIDDHKYPNGGTKVHGKCEVLHEKRGLYTMLRCVICRTESPLAMNSMILKQDSIIDNHFNCR